MAKPWEKYQQPITPEPETTVESEASGPAPWEKYQQPITPEPETPAEDLSPETDQTVIGSIARGAGAGLVDIAQGISELGAAATTATGITEEGSQRATTDFFENVKDNLGLRPERTAGRVAEAITTYGTPGLGVFNWVSKADRARRALNAGQALAPAKTWFGKSAAKFGQAAPGALTQTRTGRAALTTLGTGVADILVSPSTNQTLADSWDAMPEFLRTEDEQGLTGPDLMAARLRNKVRLGVEGATFNLAGEAILPVVGATIKGIGQVPGVPALARGLSNGFEYMGNKLLEVPYLNIGPRIKKYLTSDGLVPGEVMASIRTAEGITEGQEKIAENILRDYDKAAGGLIKAQGIRGLLSGGRTRTQRVFNDTMDYLTGQMSVQDFTNAYGTKVRKAADEMRNQVTGLGEALSRSLDDSNLPAEEIQALRNTFADNQGAYLRRLYDVNLRPEKFAGIRPETMPQYGQALAQVERAFQNRNMRIQSAIDAGRLPPVGEMADMIVSDPRAAAENFITKQFERSQEFLGEFSPSAKQYVKYIAKGAGEVKKATRGNLFRLSDGMLRSRSGILDEAPMLQEMMGVIRDPREAFLRTVNDMSNNIASLRLYKNIEQTLGKNSYDNAIAGIRDGQRTIVDGRTVSEGMARELRGYGYVKAGEFVDDPAKDAFGGSFGALSGDYVPVEVYNALTTPIRTHSAMQEALAVSLQLKGLSQMSKVVLNPLSQIRNFLSNVFILGANGLVGRNMGVFESANVLTANAIDSPEQFKFFRAMADEGVIGQNIQLNEMRRLLAEQTELGVSGFLNKAGNAFRKSTAGAPVRFMEKTYQMGDDYWKLVAGLGEKARYGAALRKAGVDIDNVAPEVQSALMQAGIVPRMQSIAETEFGNLFPIEIVRQVMPTYSMVPEAIKALRRVPVIGNFMSFPAEIMRTSGNIVNRSLKEMGFRATDELIDAIAISRGISRQEAVKAANALARDIRGIGAQRLSGYISMATVVPTATRDAAHTVLEVTPEEEALLEENSPYWTKGNTLMYLTKLDDKGQAEYADLSYMLPYEFMLAPARAAMAEYAQKGAVDAPVAEQILSSAWEGFKKFAEPFASESMAAERVYDVTLRNGRTNTGAEVYKPGELVGDKLSKSLYHVAGAFVPGVVDQFTTVKGGEFVPGRATRAATGLPSKEGDSYTIAEEAGTMLTGIRPMRLNVSRSLGYAGGEYSANRTNAVQIFTSKADDNDATVQDVLDAYVRANETRLRHQAELRDKLMKAKDAGMARDELVQAFVNSGVSRRELNDILNNRYVPIQPSRQLIREVAREVNVKRENRILQSLPMEEINKIRSSMMNMPIVPDRTEQPVEAPVARPEPAAQPTTVPATRTAPAPVMASPASPLASPQTPPPSGQSAPETRTNPIVLGYDRATQALAEYLSGRQ